MQRCIAPTTWATVLSMAIDVAALLQAKGLSDREAGRRVLAAWKLLEPRANLPTNASIAAKLGHLKRGQTTWWENHPQARRALADVLGTTAEDLLERSDAQAGDIVFREFPELPPLQIHEEPCFFSSRQGWLGAFATRSLQQGQHAWIVAPAGSGKTLAIEVLRRNAPQNVQVVTLNDLAEAARQDPKVPLLVEIERACDATDGLALVELTQRRTHTCILAPFPRPACEREPHPRWSDHAWQLEQEWRARLVGWVHGRLPNAGQLDVDNFVEWLEAIDPTGTMIATPGELLSLVAWAFRWGTPTSRIKLTSVADDWFDRSIGSHPWLRHHGRRAIRALVRRRIERLDVSRAPLSMDVWATLLPTEATPSLPEQAIRQQLEFVATGRSLKERQKRVEEGSAALITNQPAEAIVALVERGLLRVCSNGHLDVYPGWARLALERDAFLDSIKSGDSKTWGLWAVDQSRRAGVDGALDECSPPDMINLASKLLHEPEQELATVAAIEALFSALGRRMLEGWSPSEQHFPILQQLGLRQIRQLSPIFDVHGEPPLPVTRRPRDYDDAVHAQWFAEAWTFSLLVPPAEPIVQYACWHLPGWASEVHLTSCPRHLPFPSLSQRQSAGSYLRLIEAARGVLKRLSNEQLRAAVAPAFQVAVWIDGPRRGWNPTKEQFEALISSQVAAIVGSFLRGEPPDVQAKVVESIWPFIVEKGNGNPVHGLQVLGRVAPDLLDLVGATIPTEVFERDMAQAPLDDDIAPFLEMLPQRLRGSTLRVVAQLARTAGASGLFGLKNVVAYLGAEDLDTLVDLAGAGFGIGYAAAARAWSLDPRRALAEAEAAIVAAQGQARGTWFGTAPRDATRDLLALLEAHRERPNDWAAPWLARRLPIAGTEAPRVFCLLQRASASGTW